MGRLDKSADPARRLPAILPLVVYNGEVQWNAPRPGRGDSALRSFLVYAHHALGFDAVPILREVVRELAPDKEREMISAAEHYIAQGMQQGIAQGIARGVETGRLRTLRSVLTRLLVKRFGPLTPALEASIAAADAETLELWHDRATDSPTLDAVTR